MPDNPPASFAALLLAGGRSRRMGRDKAYLDWNGLPLWRHQLNTLRELSPNRLLIACREEQQLHADIECDAEWLFDPPEGDNSPLGVIAQALAIVNQPLLVLAVDMPRMTPDFLKRFLLSSPTLGIPLFLKSPHGFEPLAGLYTPALLPLLQTALRTRQLSLQPLIESAIQSGLARKIPVSQEQASALANANTPEQWNQEKKQVG